MLQYLRDLWCRVFGCNLRLIYDTGPIPGTFVSGMVRTTATQCSLCKRGTVQTAWTPDPALGLGTRVGGDQARLN